MSVRQFLLSLSGATCTVEYFGDDVALSVQPCQLSLVTRKLNTGPFPIRKAFHLICFCIITTITTDETDGCDTSDHFLTNSEGLPPKDKPAYLQATNQTTFRFRSQFYVPVLVLIYAGLLLAAWLIFSLLSRDKIISLPKAEDYGANRRWYQAAQVLWSIFGVATLLLSWSVCGFAAVGFVQSQRYRKANLMLRQTLNLAGRGCTNPDVILSLLWWSRKYGASFLYMAMPVP